MFDGHTTQKKGEYWLQAQQKNNYQPLSAYVIVRQPTTNNRPSHIQLEPFHQTMFAYLKLHALTTGIYKHLLIPAKCVWIADYGWQYMWHLGKKETLSA